MPDEFNPGDKVISDRYGSGTVTRNSCREGYVCASFRDAYDNVYNRFTGRRVHGCGTDTICHVEEPAP